jgi:hypothetical protein
MAAPLQNCMQTTGVLVPLNPYPADRIEWMPSPPLVPDEVLLDTGHLAQITLGDAGLQREVLTLFVRQSADLMDRLSSLPADAAAIAHTLNGSARGIGAFSAAACAERLERSAGDRRASIAALAELKDVVSGTVLAIKDLLRFS